MNTFDTFFKKFSYKFEKGYPDMNNEQDVLLLESMLNSIIDEEISLTEEVDNKAQTIKAVKKIIDTVGKKYDLFQGKSKPNRLGLVGKKETSFFEDIFKEVFGEETEVEILAPRKRPNPSNSFNMYSFDTEEFGKVNIIVSSQPPGGAGKKNEAIFIETLNNLIAQAGESAKIVLTSPENTFSYDGITKVVDSSQAGAGVGDKSDAQFYSEGELKANISLKQDGGFRWASVMTAYKDFIQTLINKALKGDLKTLSLKPNPDAPKKYLMFDPSTDERITKVIIPDFPTDDVESWVFGPEKPKTIVVSKTWDVEDFSLDGDTITAKASHIYKDLDELEKDQMDPVFYIAQHIGTSTGLDFRIVPSKMGNISANAREMSYKEIMS